MAAHVARALDAWPLIEPRSGWRLDLGSGGGIPGLALALADRSSRWWLLDGSRTRAEFLGWAVRQLGLSERVAVDAGRAEDIGRQPDRRGRFGVVVARSFGPPAVTAECSAPFLQVGGRLIVAEPPGGGSDRWPADPLQILGLRPEFTLVEPSAFQVLEQVEPCPERYPRRVGIPAKRPLF